MNEIFINNIYDNNLYEKQPNLNLNGIFDFNSNKLNFINDDDYEILNINEINNEITNEETNEDKERNDYKKRINEEIKRVNYIIEYLISNVDIYKIKLPNYKVYNYSDLSKNIRTKVKTKNHIFDINKFLIKNKINKSNIENISKKMFNKDIILNDSKIIIIFILNIIFDIYNHYNKSLLYSLELLNKNPLVIRDKYKDKNDNYIYNSLININNLIFNINDLKTSINIMHFNIIKNSYNKSGKLSNIIEINKVKDNYEIIFK